MYFVPHKIKCVRFQVYYTFLPHRESKEFLQHTNYSYNQFSDEEGIISPPIFPTLHRDAWHRNGFYVNANFVTEYRVSYVQ